MEPEQADTSDTQATHDVLTQEDIRELLAACYAMDAEMSWTGWEPLERLVRKLKLMWESAPPTTV